MLRLLLKKSQEGTRIIYIPGNHDDDLRALVGMRFGNIEVLEETIHTTSEGRRLLVTHGDQFDAVVRGRSLGVLLGGLACRGLLTLNRFVHWLHDLANRPYWSLAQHVKSRFPGAKGYVERFQRATLVAAREARVDGVICGHIHKADLTAIEGLLYCNDGDWVESCTALVENQAGELSLLRWRPSAAAIAASATLIVPVWSRARVSTARAARTPPSLERQSKNAALPAKNDILVWPEMVVAANPIIRAMPRPPTTLFEDAIDVPMWLEADRLAPYAERVRRDRDIARGLPRGQCRASAFAGGGA